MPWKITDDPLYAKAAQEAIDRKYGQKKYRDTILNEMGFTRDPELILKQFPLVAKFTISSKKGYKEVEHFLFRLSRKTQEQPDMIPVYTACMLDWISRVTAPDQVLFNTLNWDNVRFQHEAVRAAIQPGKSFEELCNWMMVEPYVIESSPALFKGSWAKEAKKPENYDKVCMTLMVAIARAGEIQDKVAYENRDTQAIYRWEAAFERVLGMRLEEFARLHPVAAKPSKGLQDYYRMLVNSKSSFKYSKPCMVSVLNGFTFDRFPGCRDVMVAAGLYACPTNRAILASSTDSKLEEHIRWAMESDLTTPKDAAQFAGNWRFKREHVQLLQQVGRFDQFIKHLSRDVIDELIEKNIMEFSPKMSEKQQTKMMVTVLDI